MPSQPRSSLFARCPLPLVTFALGISFSAFVVSSTEPEMYGRTVVVALQLGGLAIGAVAYAVAFLGVWRNESEQEDA